jgi:hypothetical protein
MKGPDEDVTEHARKADGAVEQAVTFVSQHGRGDE